MPTLVLREKIAPTARTSVISTRSVTEVKPGGSTEGILIFSGIGFTLLVLAIIFHGQGLPPPHF